MIGPRTKAILAPNLIGNAPDWDRIREIADRHGLMVVEDSCDALGLTLRGTPTGTRADISLTSFALSHIITAAGTGGMVCFDDDALADRALLLRRWGRRSEVQLFGSKKGVDKRFFSTIDGGDGFEEMEYDNLFIFDEVGLELRALRAVGRLRAGAARQARREPRRAGSATSSSPARHFARWPEHFTLPRLTEGVETGWHMFPAIIKPEAGIRRCGASAVDGVARRRHPHGVDRQRQPASRPSATAPTASPRAACPTPTGSWNAGSCCPTTTR